MLISCIFCLLQQLNPNHSTQKVSYKITGMTKELL